MPGESRSANRTPIRTPVVFGIPDSVFSNRPKVFASAVVLRNFLNGLNTIAPEAEMVNSPGVPRRTDKGYIDKTIGEANGSILATHFFLHPEYSFVVLGFFLPVIGLSKLNMNQEDCTEKPRIRHIAINVQWLAKLTDCGVSGGINND